jgi:formylglycine-generating enzyme required for sulfatase activity
MPIYDIIGNAYTWTSDLDPKSIITGVSAHAIRGGGWGSGSHDMRYGSPISYINDQDRICYFGFRLVRSVK